MLQKWIVLGGLNWISFSNGIVFGQMGGMINSLQKNEEELNFSEREISLLGSTFTMPTLIGFGIAAILTDRIGRKWPCSIFCATMIISWIILYLAKNMYQFIISRVIAGSSAGALLSLTIFVTSEYTSSKTRAFFLNMVTTVAPALGTSAAHAIGIALHWRTGTLVWIVPMALGVVYPYFWVESPHWLASKGKFQECESAFRMIHGTDANPERELQLLLKLEKTKLKEARETNTKTTSKRLLQALRRKYFWSLIILSIVINAYLVAAGKLLFSMLAPVLLEEITGTSDILLFTLLVDSFIIIGSCLSCALIRKTSMRTLLFSTGFVANTLLILFGICFYIKNRHVYFNWINVALLAFYFITVNAGPLPILEAILSEIFPLELKLYSFFISGFTQVGFSTLSLIIFPSTVASIGYHGFFLTNAGIMSLCLVYIWLIVPETKGKTLQEIETYFKTNNFDINQVLNREQNESLL